MAESSEQMGWRTRTSALPILDLRQIAYLLPMWGGIWSGVFLWRRLICPQKSSLRIFWYRDLNSSHFFPRFGALEHEANRTPDISATFISSRKKFCKRKRMSVCPARKRKAIILSVSYRLNRLNRCSRWRTAPFQNLCQNMVRTWYMSDGNVISIFILNLSENLLLYLNHDIFHCESLGHQTVYLHIFLQLAMRLVRSWARTPADRGASARRAWWCARRFSAAPKTTFPILAAKSKSTDVVAPHSSAVSYTKTPHLAIFQL